MPDPSTLPEDIFAILDDANDHEVNEKNVEEAGELFKHLLRTRLKRRDVVRGEKVLRFSSLGKKDRQMWYMANEPEYAEKMGGKQNFKFLYGDTIEILLLFLAKESGHEVTHEQYEVEVDGVYGHTDAVIDGVPVDCKSASSYAFDKFQSGRFKFDDPFGYLHQLGGYAQVLGKTDRAGFLVADKVNGNICFAELDGYDIKAVPPGPRIEQLKGVISHVEPPARCYEDVADGKSGNRKLPIGCSYCSFKHRCWADSNGGRGLRTFLYAKGPTFLTAVGKTPVVPEVAGSREQEVA